MMQVISKPLYKSLFEYYKDKIIVQEYSPGQQVDSINKIMQRHNVSRETAKLVLKMLADEKLVYSKAGKGSFVVPFVQTKKEWGMVIPFYSSNIKKPLIRKNPAIISKKGIISENKVIILDGKRPYFATVREKSNMFSIFEYPE